MRATAGVFLLLAVACAGSAPICGAEVPKPTGRADGSNATVPPPAAARDLPSPVVRWRWNGGADEVVLDGGTAYVRHDGSLAALRASDGTVLWEQDLGEAECAGAGPRVLGRQLAVGLEEKLVILDAATGVVERTVAVDGNVGKILGPPLLVLTLGDSSTGLLRVDPALGLVLARRNVGSMVYDADLDEGVVTLNVDGDEASNDDRHLILGLGADDLVERWRLVERAFPRLERIGGKLFTRVVVGESSQFLELDPKTGRLGPALPQRKPGAYSSSDLPWDLELVTQSDDRTRSTIRRNSLTTGQPVWTADLPCSPSATLRRASELLISCVPGAGRGTFVTLDWATGNLLRRTSGFRDVRELHEHGSLVIAQTWHDGVIAFDAEALGPPASVTTSLRDEVHRILSDESGDASPYGRGDRIGNVVSDLKALGPDALTLVTDEIPSLGSTALVAAAQVLSEAGFRRAAAPLAARLKGSLEEPGQGWDHWNPQFAVLTALAQLGGPEQVEVVAAVLSDPARTGTIRRQALCTLTAIGTPRAVEAVDRVLAGASPSRGSWWSPPAPVEFARFVGLPDLEKRVDEALQKGEDAREWWLLERAAASVRVRRPDGTALLVFRDPYLGGPGDLWVVEADGSGAPKGTARFTGISIHGEELVARGAAPLQARLDGNVLTIAEAGAKERSVDLESLEADADRDGLPDVVERRIRTDPEKADTDGDGIRDSEDAAPGATLRTPRTEDEAIQLAIFRQFFQFEPVEATGELAVVVGDAALEWAGRRGPVVSLSQAEDKRFFEEAGYDGVAHIRIQPRDPAAHGEDEDASWDPFRYSGQLRPDQRLYSFVSYRGGLNAIGYRVIVRKVGDRWLVEDLQVAYVS